MNQVLSTAVEARALLVEGNGHLAARRCANGENVKSLVNSRLLAMAGAVVGSLALTPGTARALSCATNVIIAPEADEANVPTNTLLWGYPRRITRLLGPSGNAVAVDERKLPITVEGGGAGILPVLVPREMLEPNADYTIELDDPEDQSPPRRIVFVTGTGPASRAPTLPLLLSSEPRSGSGAYATSVARGVLLRFDFDGILIGDTGQLGSIATIDALFEQGDANLAELDGAALPMIQWVSSSESVWAGINDCAVWPRGASDSELGRFGVLDLAGNFSGWATVPLELPSREEAEVAAAAAVEARRTLNVQQGRPSACSLRLPGASGAGPSEAARVGLLALAIGLVAAGARRASRARFNRG
jgi:hypothetical protein